MGMTNLPLTSLNVVEFAGLAPGPFAGLVLADWGASVVRVDRPAPTSSSAIPQDVLCRNKRSIAIDTKVPSGYALIRRMIERADVLIDPFRPGVMERLGLGPDVFLGENGVNRKLVYARLAGFPITGPHKNMAGHDLNYLALSGILSMFPGTPDKPTFPLNLLADFAGGGLACALGIVLALYERSHSGLGQVVQTDMVSGTRYVSSFPLIRTLHSSAMPAFPDSNASNRMSNTLDGGAPFYEVYTCADGRWMSVGCIEPRFFEIFVTKFVEALPESFLAARDAWRPTVERQNVREEWPRMRAFFEAGFRVHTRDHWATVFDGTDACALPVLSPAEAALLASAISDPTSTGFAESQPPTPHPHLSRTPGQTPTSLGAGNTLLRPGTHTDEILREVGVSADDRRKLMLDGALGTRTKL